MDKPEIKVLFLDEATSLFNITEPGYYTISGGYYVQKEKPVYYKLDIYVSNISYDHGNGD